MRNWRTGTEIEKQGSEAEIVISLPVGGAIVGRARLLTQRNDWDGGDG